MRQGEPAETVRDLLEHVFRKHSVQHPALARRVKIVFAHEARPNDKPEVYLSKPKMSFDDGFQLRWIQTTRRAYLWKLLKAQGNRVYFSWDYPLLIFFFAEYLSEASPSWLLSKEVLRNRIVKAALERLKNKWKIDAVKQAEDVDIADAALISALKATGDYQKGAARVYAEML